MMNRRSAMPTDFLLLAKVLAAEFQRRNMSFHLESLRLFCIDPMATRRPEEAWTEEMMVEWLALFGVPPFAKKYSSRPAGSTCERCRSDSVRANVLTLFPGGSKRECIRCGALWVERSTG
jgi:hypothetical protein